MSFLKMQASVNATNENKCKNMVIETKSKSEKGIRKKAWKQTLEEHRGAQSVQFGGF